MRSLLLQFWRRPRGSGRPGNRASSRTAVSLGFKRCDNLSRCLVSGWSPWFSAPARTGGRGSIRALLSYFDADPLRSGIGSKALKGRRTAAPTPNGKDGRIERLRRSRQRLTKRCVETNPMSTPGRPSPARLATGLRSMPDDLAPTLQRAQAVCGGLTDRRLSGLPKDRNRCHFCSEPEALSNPSANPAGRVAEPRPMPHRSGERA